MKIIKGREIAEGVTFNKMGSEVEYVHLEEAQKLEVLNKKLRSKLDTEPYFLADQIVRMTNKAIEAEVKIDEANKIVDKLAKMRFTTDKIILISQLRDTLNAQEKTGENNNEKK